MEAKDGSMGFDFAGTYTKIIEPKLIEYSFGDRKAQVEFTPGHAANVDALGRIASLRSKISFRGGAFLMRAPIRLTTSPARSVALTMPASASLTSARSGGVLSNHRSAAPA
jgi:uncharacterized protein YndB with AHSA1/START domain